MKKYKSITEKEFKHIMYQIGSLQADVDRLELLRKHPEGYGADWEKTHFSAGGMADKVVAKYLVGNLIMRVVIDGTYNSEFFEEPTMVKGKYDGYIVTIARKDVTEVSRFLVMGDCSHKVYEGDYNGKS